MGNNGSQRYNNSPQQQPSHPQQANRHLKSLCSDCPDPQRPQEQHRLKNCLSERKHTFHQLGNHKKQPSQQQLPICKSYLPVSHLKKRQSVQLGTTSNQLSRMLDKIELHESPPDKQCPVHKRDPFAERSLFKPLAFEQCSSKQLLHEQDITQFVESQQKFLEKRERSIERSRKELIEQNMKECTYRPQLNKNSLKIAERNRKRTNCIPTVGGFNAQKNKPSQKQERVGPKAQDRKAQLKHEKIQQVKYPPYTAQNNFIQAFIKEFFSVVLQINPHRRLMYLEAAEILKRLSLVGSLERIDSQKFIMERSLINDMWILISSKGGFTDCLSLLSFLLALFDECFLSHQQQISHHNAQPLGIQPKKDTVSNPQQHSFQRKSTNYDNEFTSNRKHGQSDAHFKSEMKTPPQKDHEIQNQLFTDRNHNRTVVTISQSSNRKKSTPKRRIVLKKHDETTIKCSRDEITENVQTSKRVSLAVLFENIQRSRQSAVQLSAQEFGLQFGSRDKGGFIVYSEEQIQQISAYFKLFSANKLHQLASHKHKTTCFDVQPLNKSPYHSIQMLLQDPSKKGTGEKSRSDLMRDQLAGRRKERVLEAARSMRIIKQSQHANSSNSLRKIEELLKEHKRLHETEKKSKQLEAYCTFRPNASVADIKSVPKKVLDCHSHSINLVEQPQHRRFGYTLSDKPDVMYDIAYSSLQVAVHVNDRKLIMEVTDRDTPESAIQSFLRANNLSERWREQLISTVAQTLQEIEQSSLFQT